MQLQGPNAAINQLDANGCTPLMYAVMADSKLGIEMLLNFGTKREQVHLYMYICVCLGGGGGGGGGCMWDIQVGVRVG